MISRYPDYFSVMPMMPRGIPNPPAYPQEGEILEPITDEALEDTHQEDTPEDDDFQEEDTASTEETASPEIDQNLTRQQNGGTSGTTGAAGGTGTFEMAPGSPIQQDLMYTQGYLRTQIGKRVRVTFLLGTGTLQDRTGILTDVGISYIILRNQESNTNELGDIYSIKFVTFFDD